MVHVVTKKIAILAVSLCFIAFLYSPISDFDLNNLTESLTMLKRIQDRIDAVARTRGLTTIDVHDRACLTLFGIGEGDVRVQETIQRTFDEVKAKLNPLKLSRHSASLQRAAEKLFHIINTAKEILDARFAHLLKPAKYPAVEYPTTIINLQSVIDALGLHQKTTRPFTAVSAVARALSVPRLNFSKLVTPDRQTPHHHPTAPSAATRAIAERKLTPYYVDARTSAACAGAGAASADPCPRAPKPACRRIEGRPEYVSFNYDKNRDGCWWIEIRGYKFIMVNEEKRYKYPALIEKAGKVVIASIADHADPDRLIPFIVNHQERIAVFYVMLRAGISRLELLESLRPSPITLDEVDAAFALFDSEPKSH